MSSSTSVCQFQKVAKAIEDNTIALKETLSMFSELAKHVEDNKKEEQEEEIKRNDQVTVEVMCTFLKIGEIDTMTQKFEAEVFVQAKWQEPELDGMQENEVMQFDAKLFWNPKLIIKNIAGDFAVNRQSFHVCLDEDGYDSPVIIQYWMIKGMFEENLELQHFPFDVQDLTIQVSTERSTNEVRIIEDQRVMSTVNMIFMDAQEWSIYQHVECSREITNMEYASFTEHPILHVQCRASRKVGYFVWNIIAIILMIMLLTFGTMAIDPNIPDRMVITITLFLTLVAFKLVVKSNLPTISYLTYLDKYILASLVFLGIQTAESATMDALTRVYTMDEVINYDQMVMAAEAVILLMFHFIFSIYIYTTAFYRRRLMQEKDKLYFKKCAYLNEHGVMMDTSTDHEMTPLIGK